MSEERVHEVCRPLWKHANPTLKKLSQFAIDDLANEIVSLVIDRRVWTKWSDDRAAIANRTSKIRIPMIDLCKALNDIPGPKLTIVDEPQRA